MTFRRCCVRKWRRRPERKVVTATVTKDRLSGHTGTAYERHGPLYVTRLTTAVTALPVRSSHLTITPVDNWKRRSVRFWLFRLFAFLPENAWWSRGHRGAMTVTGHTAVRFVVSGNRDFGSAWSGSFLCQRWDWHADGKNSEWPFTPTNILLD